MKLFQELFTTLPGKERVMLLILSMNMLKTKRSMLIPRCKAFFFLQETKLFFLRVTNSLFVAAKSGYTEIVKTICENTKDGLLTCEDNM